MGAYLTAPATDAARQWSGWGTALKPAWEPIIVARKPLVGTVAENVLTHGTGGINVDGCRVKGTWSTWRKKDGTVSEQNQDSHAIYGQGMGDVRNPEHSAGRWPANLIHDGSEEVVGLFPVTKTGVCPADGAGGYEGGLRRRDNRSAMNGGDSGSAARFFYCAKASKADRDEGCEGLAERLTMRYGEKAQGPLPQQTPSKPVPQRNHHPTVKPTALMRYLCRLVTPPGGVVLDPFTGSGSTGKAAVCEGFDFVGIEREAEYVEIARARIAAAVLPWEATA
jgi:site-specific DNA-methyltransferase (adenine-specific)